MWLAFALITPIFWSVVHIADSHCVDEILERPWMGITTSAVSSILVFLLIPFFYPFVSWQLPPPEIALLAIFAGMLIQISQALYFHALDHSEAGIVAAYWNMTPALLPIVGFFILHDVLTLYQYVGISLLVVSSVLLCLVDVNFHARWNTIILMAFASVFQVAALSLEKIVYEQTPFFLGFLLITFGLILVGLFPLLFVRVRRIFSRNMHKLRKAFVIFIGIEIANLFALASSQNAIRLGDPSLVAAVETTLPAYIFISSIILLFVYPKFGDPDTWHKLPQKLLIVIVMVCGVWLLA